MFEFAVASNKKYRPTGRVLASWILSCVAHSAALLIVEHNPWILQGGLHHSFRPLALVSGLFSSAKPSQDDDWRTVAIIRTSSPMQMPSEATLRKNIPDWNRLGNMPPVSIRWGTENLPLKSAPEVQPPAQPDVGKEPEIKLPPASAQIAESSRIAGAVTEKSGTESGRAFPRIEVGNAAASKPTTIPLPAPAPGGDLKSAIKALNEGSASASANPAVETAQNAAQVFDNEQKAIRSEGSGLFDTKGFPLGEYANLIIERVKGNWMIPSNLRKSQGRTTVIFYIDKDGRSADARIVVSSGSDSLDIAALGAILGSNPFPPLPKGFPGDRVGAKFVFSYNERQ